MPLGIKPEVLKKLQPKLRMIADGDTRVNVIRAERCAGLAVSKRSVAKRVPTLRGAEAVPVKLSDLKKKPKAPPLKRVTPAVDTNVFVYLRDATVKTPKFNVPMVRNGRIVKARVPLNRLANFAAKKDVSYVELAEALKTPSPKIENRRAGAPTLTERKFGSAALHHYGKDVLIGIIDVQ